ncbi:MAG: hypothetical protein FWD32_01020 [Firmicutes bacterium]|nr:hypothetical protein [Bacillota bacterium]
MENTQQKKIKKFFFYDEKLIEIYNEISHFDALKQMGIAKDYETTVRGFGISQNDVVEVIAYKGRANYLDNECRETIKKHSHHLKELFNVTKLKQYGEDKTQNPFEKSGVIVK